MRDEKLNGELFRGVLEARVVLAEWVTIYNTIRPHRGLGMQTPVAFDESVREGSQTTRREGTLVRGVAEGLVALDGRSSR